MSILHLIWIVPLCVLFGMFLAIIVMVNKE